MSGKILIFEFIHEIDSVLPDAHVQNGQDYALQNLESLASFGEFLLTRALALQFGVIHGELTIGGVAVAGNATAKAREHSKKRIKSLLLSIFDQPQDKGHKSRGGSQGR